MVTGQVVYNKIMFIPPPFLLVLAILLSYVVSTLIPGPKLVGLPFTILGFGAIFAGIGLFVWTIQLFGEHKTTLHPRGKPSSLITSGPYRFSRNPIYLGFLLIALGTSLLFANLLAFVGPVVFFFFITATVLPFEEEMLSKIFGERYQKYRKRTRRWV